MHDDCTILSTLGDDQERGYVRMFPLLECKVEAQDAFEKHAEISLASWHNNSKSMLSVKEEPLHSSDNSSRESIDEDLQPETTPCIAMDTSTSLPCSACGFTSLSLRQMWDHRFVCQAGKVHICNVCQEPFESKTDLGNHIKCHQINQLHPCQVCGSLFHRKADLQNHLVSHQIERPHKCSMCGADFQRHSSLTNHMKIHSYSPGRALFSSVFHSDSNLSSISSINQSINCTDISWESKEPIPSFETLPSPSIPYQPVLNSSVISNNPDSNYLQNKIVLLRPANALVNNVASIVDSSSFELYLNQSQELNPSKVANDEIEAHPTGSLVPVASGNNEVASSNLLVGFQQDPLLKNQSLSEMDLEAGVRCELNLSDPAYLAVKQMGSFYGIKIEESLLSAQEGSEPVQQSECGGIIQTMPVVQNSFSNKSHPSNTLPSQVLSPLSCSKCEFTCSQVEDFRTHICLPNDQWNPSACSDLSSPSQPNEFIVHSKSPAPENEATPADATESSCFMMDKDVSFMQNSVSQNKSSLKHFCVECNKKFATKQKLFRHMWIHRKKQFSCETCGAVFSERIALDGHRLAQHPPSFTAPFACSECGKTFASRQSLWEHGRVHGNVGSGGASLLWCQECNKSFASRQGYQIHIRTHTGERPYGCRFCFKSFRDGGTLRKHERIHTGERPHACPLCSRAFNQKVVLREHVRWVHAATATCEPPFSCQICSTLLNDREELCVHIVKHSDDLAAMARAAAKKESAVDNGNKAGLFANKTFPFVAAPQEKEQCSASCLQVKDSDFKNRETSASSWIVTRRIERDTNTATSIAPQVPTICFAGDSQTISDSTRNMSTECYIYSSLINNNECHFLSPLSNSSLTATSNSSGQGTVLNVLSGNAETSTDGVNVIGCSSANLVPLGKSLGEKSKYFERLDLKPGISFSDSIKSSMCVLPQQKLPCQPSFSEQVVINV